MTYKRFFAFGCSFTEYHWPTWFDVVKYDLNIPSQNWGLCGLGNVGMFHRMIEADIRNTFTDDDLIVTSWSTWHREDRYLGSWTLNGNILNENDKYDSNFIRKYWDLENDIIKNAGVMIAANKMFDIDYECSIIELDNNIYENNDWYKFYEPYITKNVFPWDHGNKSEFDAFDGLLSCDNHPDIKGHLAFVKDQLYPSLGLTIRDETVKHFNKMHNDVIRILKEMNVIVTWKNHSKVLEKVFNQLGWQRKMIM